MITSATDLSTLIGSTSAAIKIAKALSELKGDYDRAELRLQMTELMSTLADLKIALIEANDELKARDKEVERLKEAFQRREETVEQFGWRYRKAPDGRAYGLPFCPRCLEVDARLMLTRQRGGYSEVFCPHCKTQYPHARTLVELEELPAV